MDLERLVWFVRLLIVRVLSQRGQTMSEYAILVAWIALLVVVGGTKLGSTVSHMFSSTAGKL